MKEIKLTRGKIALIDDEDYEKIIRYKWHCMPHHGNYYATNCEYLGIENGKQKSVHRKMHRIILNITDPKIKIDHINGDGLDNRKENLRISNNYQNQQNRNEINKNNTSGYRGIVFHKDPKRAKPWQAVIRMNKDDIVKTKSLGYYSTAKEAAKSFDKAAIEIYGKFCGKLNFPEECSK